MIIPEMVSSNYWIVYRGFILKRKQKEQLIIPEMVSSNSFYDS